MASPNHASTPGPLRLPTLPIPNNLSQYLTTTHSDPKDKPVVIIPILKKLPPKLSRKRSTITNSALRSVLMIERPVFEEVSSEDDDDALDQPTDDENEILNPDDMGQTSHELGVCAPGGIPRNLRQRTVESEPAASNGPMVASRTGVRGNGKKKKTVTWATEVHVRHFH